MKASGPSNLKEWCNLLLIECGTVLLICSEIIALINMHIIYYINMICA